MKKLNSKLRVSEMEDFATRLVERFKEEQSLANDAFLKLLFEELEAKATEISVAIKRETATSKLDAADKLRDETIRNLNNVLQGYRSISLPEIKESADKLYTVFDRYGIKITRESYSSESAHIKSLLRDFAAEDLQPAIEKLLGVAETIEELRTRQEAFQNERVAYDKALAEQGSKASATVLKKPLVDLINVKLIPFLTAMGQSEVYKNFSGTVSQLVENTNSAIARRTKK